MDKLKFKKKKKKTFEEPFEFIRTIPNETVFINTGFGLKRINIIH